MLKKVKLRDQALILIQRPKAIIIVCWSGELKNSEVRKSWMLVYVMVQNLKTAPCLSPQRTNKYCIWISSPRFISLTTSKSWMILKVKSKVRKPPSLQTRMNRLLVRRILKTYHYARKNESRSKKSVLKRKIVLINDWNRRFLLAIRKILNSTRKNWSD